LVVNRPDEDEMAAQLVQRGPLSVLIDARLLQFYHSGIYRGWFCSQATDHAVLLTGYGNSGSTPYWLIKNSWGEKWGENGYFRLLRGKKKCGITTGVTTSCVGKC